MLLDTLFSSAYGTSSLDISVLTFILCIAVALGLGFFNAWISTIGSNSSKSFRTTLAVIPAVVCMIIMMVNGNIGTGVAVAGAFSLVRFRSVPGTAKEIGGIFVSMGAGIALGMGYIGFAVLFTVIVCCFGYFIAKVGFGGGENETRTLRITIPEDLNYTSVFDDLFTAFTSSTVLQSVKTSNMGSLYKLSYKIQLKDATHEKEFIDAIRCRNGNLEVSIMAEINNVEKL